MPIKRTSFQDDETQETPEQAAAREAEETAKAEQEAARKAELDEAREGRRKAEIEAARSAGESAALRNAGQAQVVPQWDEARWEQEGQNRGMTGQQLKAQVEIASSIADAKLKPVQDKLTDAEKRAAAAEARAERLEKKGSLFDVEKDFYEKHPELTAHRSIVKDFVDKFGNDESDPKKYAKLLDDARVYARGVVKESRVSGRGKADESSRVRSERGSERMESGGSGGDEIDDTELDLKGIKNEGSRRLLKAIHERPGVGKIMDHKRKASEDRMKTSLTDDGMGVEIDETPEFEKGQALMHKELGVS